jgi:transposase InsO family protein
LKWNKQPPQNKGSLHDEWQYNYNYFHPHKSLNRMSPATAAKIYGGVNPAIYTNYELNEIV